MEDDPITEEVRAVRRRLLAACDEDLDKWLDFLQDAETNHADRIVTLDQLRLRSAMDARTADAA